jgi:hypothetical protein
VQMSFTHRALQLKVQCISSQEIVLTDQHISILEGLIPVFRTANTNGHEKIIKSAANHIKGIWTEETGFNRDAVISICDLSGELGYSHVFLAYSQMLVWPN